MPEIGYVLLSISYVILAFYAGMILYAISGWKKLEHAEEKEPWLPVSILIAARNEAQNIETVIRDIFNQNYDANLFELIVIDDNSERRNPCSFHGIESRVSKP